VTMATVGMNPAHGGHRGASMVWAAPVDEGKRPSDFGNDSQRQEPGNEGNCCGR
jgi:hypothetical protein